MLQWPKHLQKNELESNFTETVNPRKSNIIVRVIYRYSSMDLTDFSCNYLNKLLENISKEQKSIFLLGDFNEPIESKFEWENFVLHYFSVDWEDLLKMDELNADNSTKMYLKKINILLHLIYYYYYPPGKRMGGGWKKPWLWRLNFKSWGELTIRGGWILWEAGGS